mmetsp:Transcript_34055/g.106649  ORF Transcript_34055/g.106649 Transcript_34055/m.106649 type:complete len:207 (+) Transcript_34055:353-973(+)
MPNQNQLVQLFNYFLWSFGYFKVHILSLLDNNVLETSRPFPDQPNIVLWFVYNIFEDRDKVNLIVKLQHVGLKVLVNCYFLVIATQLPRPLPTVCLPRYSSKTSFTSFLKAVKYPAVLSGAADLELLDAVLVQPQILASNEADVGAPAVCHGFKELLDDMSLKQSNCLESALPSSPSLLSRSYEHARGVAVAHCRLVHAEPTGTGE